MNQLSVVMFSTSTCVHCKPVKQALNELQSVFGDLLHINNLIIDQSEYAMKSAIEWEVLGVPTLVLFQNAGEVHKIVGSQTKDELEKIFERYIQRDVLQESSGGESDTSSTILRDTSGQTNGS